MEITSAKALIAAKPTAKLESKSEVTQALTVAEDNNRSAAENINKLTSDPKEADVKSANREASQIKVEDVVAFTMALADKIGQSPKISIESHQFNVDAVRSLLS
jgi:hypothetical protein